MKIHKQWPNESIRLIAGTTIRYENWIQAWIVTNITKRKEIKMQQKKYWTTPGCVTRPMHGGYPDDEVEKINSYFTVDIPDERDLESVKERTKQTMILKGALDERDLDD